eukprot:gnl/MRDRNA2_/MRDRNA2_72186_c0_seq2.p1 gnl/MRDRNA2_/MRDRNA2_72186_c0~~gnl/MRDRNA2_/MRDRNA2_72186_c0_seq2.p1  ORF type:complete len:280 (+),score=21.80 gnl/MRDRNA2_/MRDRNA2_72186_c0_seq2:85-924(+)
MGWSDIDIDWRHLFGYNWHIWSPKETRQHLEYEFYTIFVPYILRSGALMIFWMVLNRICKGDIREMAITGTNRRLVECDRSDTDSLGSNNETITMYSYGFTDFKEMAQKLGFRKKRTACFVALVRLLFWHWMQPLAYAVVFYAYSDVLSGLQLLLGLAVLGREALYVLFTLLAMLLCPAYLLFSPVRAQKRDAFMYFAMPEKFVVIVILNKLSCRCSLDKLACPVTSLIGLIDLCAVAALAVGLVLHNLPLPLGIGYGITGTSGIFFFVQICCCQVPNW